MRSGGRRHDTDDGATQPHRRARASTRVGAFSHAEQMHARTRCRRRALANARIASYGSRRCCDTDASMAMRPILEEIFDG